ncbi:MAG: hypothetical protein ABSF45_20865 [Terriglobia bacterium]
MEESIAAWMKKTAAQGNVKYFVLVCLGDVDSCEECKKHNGDMWEPGSRETPSFPLKHCKSKEGCRCEPVAVYADEGTVTSNVPKEQK